MESPPPATPTAQQPQTPPTRRTIISRLTQYQPKQAGASIVPYAPERLSISHDVLSPSMAQAFSHAGVPRERIQSVSALRDESPTNTVFAALRMRRALHRSKGSRPTEAAVVKDEGQAIVERHQKVLSRYKIRKTTEEDDEVDKFRNLPVLMANPHSNLYKIWQLVTLLFIIYQSLSLPFMMAFMSSSSSDTSWLDNCMTAVFAFDIVIQFNTPIQIDKDGAEYSTNRWLIAKVYSKGWLFFDVLACIPFDSVMSVLVSDMDSKGGNLSVLGLLKALRIPRLLRLVRLLRVMKLLKLRPELQRWLQYSRHANLFRLVRLVMSFLVINHYLACTWYGLVASDENKASDANKGPYHNYFASLYMCLLVVQGQNITIYDDSEYLFCIFVMVFGAVLMAVVFGNVAILIANYYESQSSHQKKMEWLFASMNRMKLPFELQNRINGYYQAMWERHGTLDGAVAAFIPELSRNLAYEVELFLRMDMINRAPIFQNCSAKVVQELVMELELQVFMPGDYIVVRGEVGNDMYFVQSGICEVTKDVGLNTGQTSFNLNAGASTVTQSATSTRTEKVATEMDIPSYEIVLKTLGQGDYFGEIALLMNCKRTANVRAQVFSELCTLTREVFESISMRYLEDRNIIEKFIMDKYDPGMLQAAMKQSQEVSMRTAAVVSSVTVKRPAAAAAQDPHNEDGSLSDQKLAALLSKIYDRIVKLENRIETDAQERRDSDIRQRIDSVTKPHPAMLYRVLSTPSDTAVAFEPDRVSQRHLLASQQNDSPFSVNGARESASGRPIRNNSHGNQPNGNPNASMLPKTPAAPKESADRPAHELPGSVGSAAESDPLPAAVIDGVGTPQNPDEMKAWKRPMLSRPGSWRNSHRDGSAESVRLRGLIRPYALTPHGSISVRHSGRAVSINAAVVPPEVLAVQHSTLRNEPEVRQHLPAVDTSEKKQEKEGITDDMLDELAERLYSQHKM